MDIVEKIVLNSVSKEAKFAMVLVEKEENPSEQGDYFCFDVLTESRKFSGISKIWISKSSFEQFLLDLQKFSCLLKGEVNLKCGWDNDILLNLELFAYDALGHLGVRCEIAAPLEGREKKPRFVRTEFEIDPSILDSLVQQILNILGKAKA
jgi:hypothetical protein